ncbi:ribosome maturation factor RimM [Ileibacterium valens]|uniref:Ribosome maturation factor RimM n=1 Tax=Ileibacterium valens TaxID=1862668 RepID=A0A1U7NHC7_9FIRM|nr:ribosome maturation factor RimM [Ileibacterium valens]OLU36237.1 16S rRNA processing protein RimM [Erysipelotrichaceae bacterium NYU-BL-E8]OLU37173.1 16S rRNA processing protein RimM [Erysipelotrichaceae bacterium NYU-BL-F16]OLU41037.1 16S rRNA processing protein RimM [Ileibacterium valens]
MIKVAKIINTRGLKGECKLYLYTDQARDRFSQGVVLYENGDRNQPIHPISYSEYKGFGYAKFKEIADIDQAKQHQGMDLYLSKEDLPESDEDEFYYSDLNGLHAIDQNGEDLGKVSDILETGATHPILRISKGSQSFMVPFAEAFVEEVDLEAGQIVIHMMEGLR